jgi:hypothetical protein
MSKESIRNQIEKLQNESKILLSSKNISVEVRLFINSMMTILEIIIAVLLEKKTKKDSSNSGLPPSRNEGPNGNRNKNRGKRDKKGEQINNTRNVETEETVSPRSCKHCNKNLKNVTVKETLEKKRIDIIYEVETHTVISEVKECPGCGTINKGVFPKGMNGEVQYGNGIKATIINFLVVQMMSLERVQEHLNGLISRFISQTITLNVKLPNGQLEAKVS